MKRAVSDQQRALVDSHFAAIEEEMDEGRVLTEKYWKSLLAKSQLVKLPPLKAEKRDAMEIDDTNHDDLSSESEVEDENDSDEVKALKVRFVFLRWLSHSYALRYRHGADISSPSWQLQGSLTDVPSLNLDHGSRRRESRPALRSPSSPATRFWSSTPIFCLLLSR